MSKILSSPNKFFCLLLVSILLLGGCARDLGSDEFTDSDVNSVQQSYRGVIISRRQVTIRAKDKLGDNTTGMIGGGVGGALLGSQFGAGRGQVVGGVLGAAAGAIGGALAERALTTQKGMEYTVELTSGRVIAVMQGLTPLLEEGQSVFVLVPTKGRPRVIADRSGGVTHHRPSATPRRSGKKSSGGSSSGAGAAVVPASIDGDGDRYSREQMHATTPSSVVIVNNNAK